MRCVNWNRHGRQKRKHIFVKNNVTRDVHMIGWNMEILVPFVLGAVSKKHTFLRTKLEFALIVRAWVRPTSTTKNFQKSVIRRLIEELSTGVFILSTRVGMRFMRK
jgi:hypothetical protein